MKKILRATKDTYITDRVIRDRFRATDANVGQAGTLDLFKLAGESTFSGSGPFISGSTDEPIELSRVLIKFDLNPLASLTSSILDAGHSSFRCVLRLVDVLGGQTLPSNFTLVLYPLSQSFDEGIGRDVNAFEDIDASNFITASVSNGANLWFATGANALGYVGQASIDVITGSTLLGDLFVTQSFAEGDEDLEMDVTRIVSATLARLIPDHGFRISFSGTQETDSRTRFVKRFATRHSNNPRLRPMIEVGFDDSVQDYHESFYFDVSGSLFLNSFRRGVASNIVSGSALTQVTGQNCMLLTLTSGSDASGTFFRRIVTASQHFVGLNPVTGVYSASFAIAQNASGTLLNEIRLAGSATFTEVWGSLDGTVGYHTGSLVVFASDRSAFSNTPEDLRVTMTNMKTAFRVTERARLRVFVQDGGFNFRATKLPIESSSIIYDNMHYRVVDVNSDQVIFDFDTRRNSTRLSCDSDGMYFDLNMSDLDVGRMYGIDILLDARGASQIYRNVGGTFRVDP